MILYKKIALILTLLGPFTLQAKECKSTLIDWNDYEKTLYSLKTAYYNEDYFSIESAFDCLMMSKKTFISGKPGSVATYWFFRNEMPGPGADEQDELRIKKWKTVIQNSPYANFSGLRLMYAQAWNARGSKYANETSEYKFKRFREKLLLTESAILSEKNKLKDTAISYNLLMAVTLDTRGTKTSPLQAFEIGVANWPNYYDFYEVFLTRLVPKWGGSWKKVDDFINYWDKKLQEQESKSLYSRLYYNVHSHDNVNPHSTRADWSRLKSSLVALYTTYPAKTHFEIAASYACYYSDYSFYNKLISEHKVGNSEAWLSGSNVERCNEYFESLPSK